MRLRTDVCLSDRRDNCSSEPHWPVGRYNVTGEDAFAHAGNMHFELAVGVLAGGD